jgi:hypothetical protein
MTEAEYWAEGLRWPIDKVPPTHRPRPILRNRALWRPVAVSVVKHIDPWLLGQALQPRPLYHLSRPLEEPEKKFLDYIAEQLVSQWLVEHNHPVEESEIVHE